MRPHLRAWIGRKAGLLPAALLAACFLLPGSAEAGQGTDWPTWRCDAERSGATSLELPASLGLQWMREFPPPAPAWPDEPRVHFDLVYEPVVAGKTMFVGLNSTDKVVALDTDTGAEKWTFYTGGPVRFAPVAWNDRVFVASDDGCLYCLDAAGGSLLWKFRGGPSDRAVLGNTRLVSTWSARGGPVLADGTVYFAAGIWPFMGVFIHALDAQTGRVVWTNDSSGSIYASHPHGAMGFGGVAPQGYLVAVGDRLVVPSGRSRPAVFHRDTGELLCYRTGWYFGSCFVAASPEFFFNGRLLFDLETGSIAHGLTRQLSSAHAVGAASCPVLADGQAFVLGPPGRGGAEEQLLDAYDTKAFKRPPLETAMNRYEYDKLKELQQAVPLWSVPCEADALYLRAGSRLYASREEEVLAIELPQGGQPRVAWRVGVADPVGGMIAADGKLFVSTRGGRIYCFGAGQAQARQYARAKPASAAPPDEWTRRAADILKTTGLSDGYALVLGLGTGRLIEELARQSRLNLIGMDPDPQKVDALRRRLDAAGLYGERVALLVGEPVTFPFPPYLASLIVSEDLQAAGIGEGEPFVQALFRPLRPYGGVACLEVPADALDALADRVASAEVGGPTLRTAGGFALIERPGPLPGSAYWTHQAADAGNTNCSRDDLCTLPMGMLWFGGPAGENVFFDRHHGAPCPQVAGGRLIVEGPSMLRAIDVYTGRVLWDTSLPGLGTPFGEDTRGLVFQPRAGLMLGGDYVSLADAVYARLGSKCLTLDPATGTIVREFALPGGGDWGYLAVWEDSLIAGGGRLAFRDAEDAGKQEWQQASRMGGHPWNGAASARLVVMDRRTGEVRWEKDAALGFRHAATAVGNGKVFVIDRMPEDILARLGRGDRSPGAAARLAVFDIRTGDELWETTADVTGSWLAYSEQHDVLVQGLDRATGGGDYHLTYTMVAYSGRDGTVLWRRPMGVEAGAGILRGGELICGSSMVDLREGTRCAGRLSPRAKGCDAALGAEHMVLFRSSAAGYFDLDGRSGTGNFGGFRSSCGGSLIAADGVIASPKYAQGCGCNTQNQASLALVHDPSVETWTWGGTPMAPIRVGINLGAPGDRVSAEGTFWQDFPPLGGPSRDLDVSVEPAAPQWFRHHPSWIEGEGLDWVASSGGEGVKSVTVTLPAGPARDGRFAAAVVRLYFAEPRDLRPGERVFTVSLQGRAVLKDFDVVAAAGGPKRVVVREFRGVRAGSDLKVTFAPSRSAGHAAPVICGIEVVGE